MMNSARRARSILLLGWLIALSVAAPVALGAPPEEDPVAPKARDAIDRGLAWLKEHQQPDGSWETGTWKPTVAVTSLAARALMAGGATFDKVPYDETLVKAVNFVIAQQYNNGSICTDTRSNAAMYEQGIATEMLAEAHRLAEGDRQQRIDGAVRRSVGFIVAAQRPRNQDKPMPHTGGWRYRPSSSDSDISVTVWQLDALRAAADRGFDVPQATLDAGAAFVRRCAHAGDSAGFTYQAGQGPANAMRSGAGIVVMETCAEHGTKEALQAGDYLLDHLPTRTADTEFFYDAVYVDSRAFHLLGGAYWTKGYPVVRDRVLAGQNEEGFWAHGVGQEMNAGSAYRTSMALLVLCEPYAKPAAHRVAPATTRAAE